MNDMSHVRRAQRVALAVPALLLAGAYVSQYGFDLYPCEMCWWQRYPHFAALGFALLSFLARPKPLWLALAAGGMLTSGAIGFFHAGVEYDFWEGITSCAAVPQAVEGQSALDAIMNAPVVRCDEAPWTLLGISLAGFNFLISTAAGLYVFYLLRKGATDGQDA
ncbi:disulfide bond formation protein B [Qipengyuania vesicularis]|uniref:disulfide bond formation protein B n=1 Tax=Qipengyuania vesicularis TaxID=2867232 RepID=UPI001C882C27|nr:disulfide bond formation protein B [Qipengyuania vesicularis]MBX7528284.1 disulfide bond formation protein B [Qipengyuania vesicularis]